MTQIQITNVKRYPSYVEVFYKMSFTLPAIYGTGSNPIVGLDKIVSSYPDGWSIETIPVTGTVLISNGLISVATSQTQTQIQTSLQTVYSAIRTRLDGLAMGAYDNLSGTSWDGTSWTNANLITDYPTVNNNLGLTATGLTGAAVTLTIPAVQGKFHNIVYLSLTAYSTAARTGVATPILVTTTNIPGSIVFNFATAAAIGTTDEKKVDEAIKSLVANTITTIACPATTGIIWRVNIFYTTI